MDWVYPVADPPPPNLEELTVGPNFSLTCTAIGPLLLDPLPLLAPLAKIGMVVVSLLPRLMLRPSWPLERDY